MNTSMELLRYNVDFILRCTRDEQEEYLFGKTFLCKIKGEYFAGKFDYATPVHPEIFFKTVPWNPSGHQLRTSYGWEGIWQIID